MTTKAKCFDLASKHGLTIEFSFRNGWKSSSVDLPDGYVDYDGRTGLCFETCETSAKDFWKSVYADVQDIITMKHRWKKIDREKA